MTAEQAIARADRLRPNVFSTSDKLLWLAGLDEKIRREILSGYEQPEDSGGLREDGERPLLVAAPYDELYIHYLNAQMDYANGEFDRFNNANAMFEAVYSAFRNAYNASHTHLQHGKKYW